MPRRRPQRPLVRVSVTEKICTKCGRLKPAGEFGVSNNGSTGLQSWCRRCKTEEARTRRHGDYRCPHEPKCATVKTCQRVERARQEDASALEVATAEPPLQMEIARLLFAEHAFDKRQWDELPAGSRQYWLKIATDWLETHDMQEVNRRQQSRMLRLSEAGETHE